MSPSLRSLRATSKISHPEHRPSHAEAPAHGIHQSAYVSGSAECTSIRGPDYAIGMNSAQGASLARICRRMERESLVVVDDANLAFVWRAAHVVRTMLDMIEWLERAATSVVTVVLGGDYAEDRELVRFLRETYPSARVVVGAPHAIDWS